MSRPSSSISSSELEAAGTASLRPESNGLSPEAAPVPVTTGSSPRGALTVLAWTALFLVLFDVAVNLLLPFPRDPRAERSGSLRAHFEYGRSIEGKLEWMLDPEGEHISPVAKSGWLEPDNARETPATFEPGGNLRVVFYGMSFSNQVARALAALDPDIRIRLVAGPAAPPSHSFAAFQRERQLPADVAVFGILADQVAKIPSMTGATWNFDLPNPYTYPRYYLREGRLEAVWPEIRSVDQLRRAMRDRALWERFITQLEQHDTFYRAELFTCSVWDRSALFRELRRAWARRAYDQVIAQAHTPAGFVEESEAVQLLRAMVIEFAVTARADGRLPVVLLLNTAGMKDHLYRTLEPTLAAHAIPYVSTHEVAPPTDLRNYQSDNHFTPEANRRIAQRVLEALNRSLERSGR